MGISVQVHEKTGKIGTWAYQNVEEWYLETSPEHYRTHRCHIKSTNSERFTDTIHFNHKNLTRPTITHADKVMAAIADCAKSIKNLGNVNGGEAMWQLIQITERAMKIKTSNATATPITTGVPASSRVPMYANNDTQQTRSMTPPIHQIPQLFTPSLPRVYQSTKTNHKHWTKKHKTKLHTSAPAHNTRSRTQATGPAIRTRARTKLTKIKSITQTWHVATVDAAIAQLENDFHQALVVMATNNDTQQTRYMTPPTPQVPQLSTPLFLSVDQSTKTKYKHRTKKHKNKFHTTEPAHNTRSWT